MVHFVESPTLPLLYMESPIFGQEIRFYLILCRVFLTIITYKKVISLPY